MVAFLVFGKIIVPTAKFWQRVINAIISLRAFFAATLWFQFWQYYDSTDTYSDYVSEKKIDFNLKIRIWQTRAATFICTI